MVGVATGKEVRHQEGLGLGAGGQLVPLPQLLTAPQTLGLEVDSGPRISPHCLVAVTLCSLVTLRITASWSF